MGQSRSSFDARPARDRRDARSVSRGISGRPSGPHADPYVGRGRLWRLDRRGGTAAHGLRAHGRCDRSALRPPRGACRAAGARSPAGLGLLAVGSALSAVAPNFVVLALAQVPIGIGVGLTYSAAVAAVAEWSRPEDRSRVLAVALLGPPLAWVVGMPLGGAAGEASWRLSWIVVPLVLSLAGLAGPLPAAADAPCGRRSWTAHGSRAAGRRALVARGVACVLRLVGRARVHRRAVRGGSRSFRGRDRTCPGRRRRDVRAGEPPLSPLGGRAQPRCSSSRSHLHVPS